MCSGFVILFAFIYFGHIRHLVLVADWKWTKSICDWASG